MSEFKFSVQKQGTDLYAILSVGEFAKEKPVQWQIWLSIDVRCNCKGVAIRSTKIINTAQYVEHDNAH